MAELLKNPKWHRTKARDFGGKPPHLVTTWEESVTDGEIVRTRTLFATPMREERIDCFCCSCDDSGELTAGDMGCRKHGSKGLRRPCDIHNLPGTETANPYFHIPVTEQRNTYGKPVQPEG